MATAHARTVEPAAAVLRPRLRLVPAPSGGHHPTSATNTTAQIPGQQCLDLPYLLPGGLPAIPEIAHDLTLPAPRRCPPDAIVESGPPSDRDTLPAPGPWAARLAQACLEVCTAGRPVQQLLRWTTPQVFDDLAARYTPLAHRPVQRRTTSSVERVRSVHVCEPANGVVEAAAVIVGGERPRAVALRLEGWRDRWICTALEWV